MPLLPTSVAPVEDAHVDVACPALTSASNSEKRA